MTSLRQIAANQLNATKSTGPRTEAGKSVSRANALQHGLAGAGVVTVDDDEQKITARLESWSVGYELRDEEDEWNFRDYIVNTVRIDRCHVRERALLINLAARAELCWDEDRRLDVEQIGDALARKPALTLSRLRKSLQGCDWLIERWTGLLQILDRGDWNEAQVALAFNMLGTPIELRGGSPCALGETPRELAGKQIALLESLKTRGLDELDAFERASSIDGMPIERPRSLVLLERYEAACHRRLQQARRRLTSARRDAAEKPKPTPRPAPAPQTDAEFKAGFERGMERLGIRKVEEPPPPPATPTATFAFPSLAPAPRPMNRKQRRAAEKRAAKR